MPSRLWHADVLDKQKRKAGWLAGVKGPYTDVAAISPGNYVRALTVGTSTTVEVVTPEDDMGYGNLRRLGPLVLE